MLVLSAQDQQKLLPMADAINVVAHALKDYSAGRANTPIRTSLPITGSNATSLFMPSLLESAESLGIKVVSVYPNNSTWGKKTINGVMLLLDIHSGEPLCLLEASAMTVLRTAAASGLATRYLSRSNSKTLGVIGTGEQAKGLVNAMTAVRSIERVFLFNRTRSKADQFAISLRQQLGVDWGVKQKTNGLYSNL